MPYRMQWRTLLMVYGCVGQALLHLVCFGIEMGPPDKI